QWHQVTVTYNGTRGPESVKIYVDGTEQTLKVLLDGLHGNKAPIQPFRIGAGGGADNRFRGFITDVRVYERTVSATYAMILGDGRSINEIASIPIENRTKADQAKILAYFLENAAPQNIREANQRITKEAEHIDEFYEDIPTVMVMEEMAKPREAHLLLRGAYD